MLWGIPLSRVHDLKCHEKHKSEFQVRKLKEPGQPLGLQSNMAAPIINTEKKPSISPTITVSTYNVVDSNVG